MILIFFLIFELTGRDLPRDANLSHFVSNEKRRACYKYFKKLILSVKLLTNFYLNLLANVWQLESGDFH